MMRTAVIEYYGLVDSAVDDLLGDLHTSVLVTAFRQ